MVAPMTQAEFLERFDRRLERLDAHIERGNEIMARNTEAFNDLRTFTRDLVRRNEVVLTGMANELADLSDQTRANTRAVLAVLDRLEPSSG
jgi:hypothetical protein